MAPQRSLINTQPLPQPPMFCSPSSPDYLFKSRLGCDLPTDRTSQVRGPESLLPPTGPIAEAPGYITYMPGGGFLPRPEPFTIQPLESSPLGLPPHIPTLSSYSSSSVIVVTGASTGSAVATTSRLSPSSDISPPADSSRGENGASHYFSGTVLSPPFSLRLGFPAAAQVPTTANADYTPSDLSAAAAVAMAAWQSVGRQGHGEPISPFSQFPWGFHVPTSDNNNSGCNINTLSSSTSHLSFDLSAFKPDSVEGSSASVSNFFGKAAEKLEEGCDFTKPSLPTTDTAHQPCLSFCGLPTPTTNGLMTSSSAYLLGSKLDPDHFTLSPSDYNVTQEKACPKARDFACSSIGPTEADSLLHFSEANQDRSCMPWTSLNFVQKVDSSENSARLVKRSQSSGEEDSHSFHSDYTKPEGDFTMETVGTHFRDFTRAPQQPHSSPLSLANPTQVAASATAPMRSSPLFYDVRLKGVLIDSAGRTYFMDPEKLEPTDEEDFEEEDEDDEAEEEEEDEILISGNQSC
ncbi:unnamed protein product [Schistocephalus solidus]|uniref:Uncharacterized protein n=1 Tax=Schistocephalus solidus TaxID=70667 RepID=A0A183SRS8_SCHSO|nr:unnamed protein product [Schistocephalus solidus]